MLSFASTLASQLKNANPVSFWVLKLYYNDESAFIGVSDQDRVDGSDVYHGLVSSWGTLSQSMNFFTFKTNPLNMSVKLINTEHSIQGGRFSDLLAAKNFANRKWELFQVSSGYSTWDAPANLIGSGIISGNIKYNTTFVDFTLLDYSSKKHKKIPASTVTSASYPNAPEKNLNKPIPMAYGDFHEKTDIGTIPTAYFDRFKQFYKSAYPAIITDKFDVGEAAIEAYVDTQAMHTLDNENVYYYKSGVYPTITGTVDATTNNPRIEFSGATCKAYYPLSSSGFTTATDSGSATHTNEANISNLDFSDSSKTQLYAPSGKYVTVNYALPQIDKLGVYGGITAITKFGTVTGGMASLNQMLVGTSAYSSGTVVTDAELSNSIAGVFSGDTDSWDFEGVLSYKLLAGQNDGAKTVQIVESGIVVEFDIENVESHKTTEMIEVTEKTYGDVIVETQFEAEREVFYEDKVVPRTATHTVPSEVDYVYCSGKGRKYGTWIDSFDGDPRTDLNGGEPDPNYAANDCIENPVYIIEDILRTELSLGAADDHEIDIDIQTFDKAGNAQTDGTKGDIALTLNDAVADIKFAFSQPKFIGSKDLIERIGRQICSWVWISANGLFKIRTLLRPGSTWAEDKVVDYRDITLKSISRSPIDAVRNSVVTNYNYDHGESQFKGQTSAATDSGSNSSQSSDVEGFNQVLKLELDTDTLDSTTAGNIRAAHLNIFKDRKVILDFDCHRPVYNDLEITDVIKFENWDSKIKIYGTAMGTDYYMITNISKTPFGCSIKAIKVSA
jgi:hypothetical protein